MAGSEANWGSFISRLMMSSGLNALEVSMGSLDSSKALMNAAWDAVSDGKFTGVISPMEGSLLGAAGRLFDSSLPSDTAARDIATNMAGGLAAGKLKDLGVVTAPQSMQISKGVSDMSQTALFAIDDIAQALRGSISGVSAVDKVAGRPSPFTYVLRDGQSLVMEALKTAFKGMLP